MNCIGAIYYINLAHRTDRNTAITAEIAKLAVPPEKVHRIDALYTPDNGAYGCILSHIKAIEQFLQSPHDICIILEDDFTFHNKNPNSRITSFFAKKIDWEAISLAYNPSFNLKFIKTSIPGISRVVKHATTSGYMIRRTFAPRLLDNFNETKLLMEQHGRQESTCLDINWQKLQAASKWYAFTPALGYQREGYSDIEKRHVAYKC